MRKRGDGGGDAEDEEEDEEEGGEGQRTSGRNAKATSKVTWMLPAPTLLPPITCYVCVCASG